MVFHFIHRLNRLIKKIFRQNLISRTEGEENNYDQKFPPSAKPQRCFYGIAPMTWWRLISTWCCPGCSQLTVQDLACLQNSYLGHSSVMKNNISRSIPQRVPDKIQSSCESVGKSGLLRWGASAPNPALGSQQHRGQHTLFQLQLLPQITHHLHRKGTGSNMDTQ